MQVWRQLWRVLERCHVACLLADARFPLLHLNTALFHYLSIDLRKARAPLLPPLAPFFPFLSYLPARSLAAGGATAAFQVTQQ